MRWRLLKLNWSYGIGELGIVVAGVLIALGIDSWNGARLERKLEVDYLNRLAADLESHRRADDNILRLLEEKITGLREIVALLEQPRDESSVERLADALVEALRLGFAQPEYTSATFDELISTGRLALIRDVDLRASLSRYENARRLILSRIAGRQTDFPALASGLLPPEIGAEELVTLDRQTRELLSLALDDLNFRRLVNAERRYAAFMLDVIPSMQEVVEQLLRQLRDAADAQGAED